jgi:CheY-like chemotaxis protein
MTSPLLALPGEADSLRTWVHGPPLLLFFFVALIVCFAVVLGARRMMERLTLEIVRDNVRAVVLVSDPSGNMTFQPGDRLRVRGVLGGGYNYKDALDDEIFEIVLMDVQMPDMTGVETTRHIRQREHDITKGRAGSAGASFGLAPCPHLPIVATTAHVMESDRDACLAAGMDAFLSKPIAASELLDTMARLRPQVA